MACFCRFRKSLGVFVIVVAMGFVLATSSGGAVPTNDFFASATSIRGSTNYIAISNAGATSEPLEPGHAGEPATHSLWWAWTAPFTGTFLVTTRGSSFDTVLAVYQGNALANLSVVATNDDTDGIGFLWSIVNIRAYAGETLYIAVDGVGGATGNIVLGVGLAGSVMSPWEVTDLNGQILRSTNFADKVLLVDFWETTCGACVEELPNLFKVQTSMQPRGFSLIGLAIDASSKVVSDYLSDRPANYPMAMSSPAVEKVFGGTFGVPTKYVVDREGRNIGYILGGHTVTYYADIIGPLVRESSRVLVSIQRQGNAITLSWPASQSGYQVEATTDVISGAWTAVSAPVVVTNNQNVATLSSSNAFQFYRLSRP